MKAKAIHELYETKKHRIVEATHSEYAIKALDALFRQPVFNIAGFVKLSNIPLATAKRIIKRLKDSKIILPLEAGAGSKGETFAFIKLIDIIG